MRLLIGKDEQEVGLIAASQLKTLIKNFPDGVFAFPFSQGLKNLFDYTIHMVEDGRIDFANISVMGTHEWVGLSPQHSQSIAYQLNDVFFKHLKLKEENIYVFDGKTPNLKEACRDYNMIMDDLGGLDVLISEVGPLGQMAMIEPAGALVPRIHVSTLLDLSKDVVNGNDVKVDQAITLGIADFLSAKHVYVIAYGKNQREVVQRLLKDKNIDPQFPVSFLHLHHNATLITDWDAVGDLVKENS